MLLLSQAKNAMESLCEQNYRMYSQDKKTLMRRMSELNLDFLVKKVPQVLAHLDKVNEPSKSQDAYHARLSSRAFENVAVVFL